MDEAEQITNTKTFPNSYMNYKNKHKEMTDDNKSDPIIDKLQEEILISENKIKSISSSIEVKFKKKEKTIENLNVDIDKNNSRISLLHQFIESEYEQNNKVIKLREEDKMNCNVLLKELEEEISQLKNISSGDKMLEILKNSNTRDIREKGNLNYEELKTNEDFFIKLEDKKQKIEFKLNELTLKKNEYVECINMLNEERLNVDLEVVNLTSHKESIEEIININNFSFFKNTSLHNINISTITSNTFDFNSSINNMKSIDLFYNEIILLDKNRLASLLYETLIDMFTFEKNNKYIATTTSFSISKSNSSFNKSITIPNFTIDKFDFESLIKRSIDNYKEGKGLFNVDDFFYLITKKIYDLILTSGTVSNKIFIKELNVEKLRIFLKHFFKIQYYDHIINTKINFINKEYKFIKKEKKNLINEINTIIKNLLNMCNKLEIKEKETRVKIDFLLDHPHYNRESVNIQISSFKFLDTKFKSLIDLKNELNVDILNMKNKHKKKVKVYIDQSNQIALINEELRKKKVEIEKSIDELQINSKERIIGIRNDISVKFGEIKKHLNNSESYMNVSGYINRLNHTFKQNLITRCLSPFKLKANYHSHTLSHANLKSKNTNLDFTNCEKTEINNKNFYKRNRVKNMTMLDGNDNNMLNEDKFVMGYKSKKSKSIDKIENSENKNNTYNTHSKTNSLYLHTDKNEKNEIMMGCIKNLKNQITENDKEDKMNRYNNTFDKRTNETDNKLFSKMNPLFEGSFCYKRIINLKNTYQYFDPISDFDNNPENLGFTKHFIYLDQKMNHILFYNSKQNKESLDSNIPLEQIEKTIVSKRIKNIINLHQIVKNLQKNNIDIENYFRINKTEPNDSELRMKYLMNKYFNMILKMTNGIKYEIIFLCFEDFKNWLNGYALIIKNRDL